MWAIFHRMTRIETRLGVKTVHRVSVLWQEEDGARKHVVFDPSTQARKQRAVDIVCCRGRRSWGRSCVVCLMPTGRHRCRAGSSLLRFACRCWAFWPEALRAHPRFQKASAECFRSVPEGGKEWSVPHNSTDQAPILAAWVLTRFPMAESRSKRCF